MRPTADVLVIGAGPAGAVSALLLAGQGLDVVLIDRDAFPRPKPCGDCLSAGVSMVLARLGLLDRVLAAGPARLDGWEIVAPGGAVGSGRFDGTSALAVERVVFDDVLVEAARRAGARVERGRVDQLLRDPATGLVTGVVGRDAGGEPLRLRARLVVGADGLRSVVARRLGLVRRRPRLRKVSLTTHLAIPGLDRTRGEMHVLDGGCIGFAPVGGGRFNLTLVVSGDATRPLRDLGPERFLARWTESVPALHRTLGDSVPGPILASGPFDWPVRRAIADGAALVGDAAGYYDPFTGQGVYHAMAGGELLAETVGPALRDGSGAHALRRYARRHRRLTRPSHRLQRVIELALSRPGPADLVLGRLARVPAVMDRLLAVTGDLLPARSLISPALVATFLLPSLTESR